MQWIPCCLFVVVLAGSCRGEEFCCTANKLSLTMTSLAATLQVNSTEPTIFEDIILVDNDYETQMQRYVGRRLIQTTNTWVNYIQYNDFNTGVVYTLLVDGTCIGNIMTPGLSMLGPCVGSNDTNYNLDYSYEIRSGDDVTDVNVYTGLFLGTLRITWHLAAADCTPISMNNYGLTADGREIVLNTYMFEDVVQGTLREPTATELPDACKTLDVNTLLGK